MSRYNYVSECLRDDWDMILSRPTMQETAKLAPEAAFVRADVASLLDEVAGALRENGKYAALDKLKLVRARVERLIRDVDVSF